MCVHDQAVKSIVTQAAGFTLTNEGTDTKPKWGYVGNTTGAVLRLEVNTQIDKDGSRPATVYLAHLKSYTNMGVAKIRRVPALPRDCSVLHGSVTAL